MPETPIPSSHATPRDQIEAILDRYYAAFNALDADAVVALFDPDCEFVDHTLGRRMRGREALRDFVEFTRRTSPGFHLEPRALLVEGDRAAVDLEMSGRDPDTDAAWSVPSSSRFAFRDDKIVYKADLWNLASVLSQTGRLHVPAIEPREAPPLDPATRRDRAAEIARSLFGIETVPEASDDGFVSPGLEHLFGEIWARPGLALRDRSLITVAALTVLAREEELRFHMRGALGAGVRPDEIREAVLHLAYYGGYPVAAIGRRAAADVLPPREAS